ncbi:MAG: hypothetical protein ABSH48_01040 [Verrucomicrobiota bacterium]
MIEDVESLKFFTVEGQWAKNAADGKGYSATRLAFKAAKQEPIGRFNIVGYIPSTRQFVNLDHGHGKGGATAVPTVGPVPPEAFIPGPAPSQGLAAQEVEAA